jgi:endonuclease YncB( thermonuclease family)
LRKIPFHQDEFIQVVGGDNMAKGLLEVSGTIDLAQFWPAGDSDADTMKVKLSGLNAFRFRPYPGAPLKVTHAFEGATVRGKVSKPAIDKQGRVTIRLQGIDAPELHYRPTAPTINGNKPSPTQRANFNAANGNFRQYFGETATDALEKFLTKAGQSPIRCVVRTAVDEADEVFDTYGRLVGDIFVRWNGKEQDVNHWLCEKGWAYPTFYSSMTKQEINGLIKLADKARSAKAGIWKKASSELTQFDRSLVFRSHGALDPAHDVGLVIMPKLFRRRSTFGIARLAHIASGSFKSYLTAESDGCFKTSDFLSQGLTAATPRRLNEFVTTASRLTVGPKDLVFQEKPSKVIDKNGKPVHW